jgi:hypothetical protein
VLSWLLLCLLPAAVPVPDDAFELRSFTPSFLWLLRDFYLDLEEDGHKVCWVWVVCGWCGATAAAARRETVSADAAE